MYPIDSYFRFSPSTMCKTIYSVYIDIYFKYIIKLHCKILIYLYREGDLREPYYVGGRDIFEKVILWVLVGDACLSKQLVQ